MLQDIATGSPNMYNMCPTMLQSFGQGFIVAIEPISNIAHKRLLEMSQTKVLGFLLVKNKALIVFWEQGSQGVIGYSLRWTNLGEEGGSTQNW